MKASSAVVNRNLKSIVHTAISPFAFCNHGFESDAVAAGAKFDVAIGVGNTAWLAAIKSQKNEREFTSSDAN